MNYDNIATSAFTVTARATDVYNAAQDWIANDAPVLEQRIKRTALRTAVALLPLAIIAINFAQDQLEQAPVYRIRLRLFSVRARLTIARKIAAILEAPATGKAIALWANRGSVAKRAMDSIFCLEV